MNQHSPVVPEILPHRSLEGGKVSLAPFSEELFEHAVAEGGGSLCDLCPDTKGLIWLSPQGLRNLVPS